jgi:hypothetical protein
MGESVVTKAEEKPQLFLSVRRVPRLSWRGLR